MKYVFWFSLQLLIIAFFYQLDAQIGLKKDYYYIRMHGQ